MTDRPMMDRRQLLVTGAAAWASVVALPAVARASGADLGRLLDAFAAADLDATPEEATLLGLDTGARAAQKATLDDRSRAGIAAGKRRISDQLAQLLALDASGLTGIDRVHHDVVLFRLRAADASNRRHDYGGLGAKAPYAISQLTGAYTTVPDLLDGQHQIAAKPDVDAYLARLSAFAAAMDQEIDTVRHDAAQGCAPPDFVLARARAQLAQLRSAPPERAGLVTSLAQRAERRGIPGDHAAQAARLVRDQVYPAIGRQIALVDALAARASHDAGVWKLPDGEQYYADAVTAWTTSPLPAAEIHRRGIDAVAEATRRIDELLRRQGRTDGTVGERLRHLFDDSRLHYADTEAGKQQLLADLNARVRAVRARLPRYFGLLPRAEVVVKRVPAYMESARPRGYYQPPALDGTRAGTYFINLRSTAELPSWTLPNAVYHQTIPGHHLKNSVYQEARLPLIRKLDAYASYLEGWSLYAEQLADEMGMYDDDPLGRIGYLHGALLCAVRLVVDTGLHAMRWSRERAIGYYTDALGEPIAAATTEIERYCISPGQACTYVLDKLAILALRDKAKAALAGRFDIRCFHDAILSCGAVPESVLATVVDRYIAASGRS